MRRLLVTLVALVACKNESAVKPAPSASASTAAPSASVAPPAGPSEWSGTYESTRGTLYVPDAAPYEGFKFRGDDGGSVGIGSGTLSFTLDPDGGSISGKLEGPLGPATLTGVAQGGELTFHLAPAEGSETAFTGTGTGALDGGVGSGEIHASSWHANLLRDATFTAKTHASK